MNLGTSVKRQGLSRCVHREKGFPTLGTECFALLLVVIVPDHLCPELSTVQDRTAQILEFMYLEPAFAAWAMEILTYGSSRC